jgi:outer membrane murein-binding lipoprotein Lpp
MSGRSNTAIGDGAHPTSSSKITTKVQELAATVAQQRKGMDVLTAQLKEQAAQIQK